jgi:phosphoglycerate dehydrogenase-like enzyme
MNNERREVYALTRNGDALVRLVSSQLATLTAMVVLALAATNRTYADQPSTTGMDPETSKLVEELGLIEDAKPIRESKGWKRPRKVVIRSVSPAWLERFQSVAPGVQIVQAAGSAEALPLVRDADVVIGICDPGLVATGKRIQWIHALWAGVEDCSSIPALRERGILLTNTQRVMGPTIAEHSMALMLALARGLNLWIPSQQTGTWADENSARLQVVSGKTLLVSGLGGIGTEVARRAHALGMKVVATRASGKSGPDFVSYVGSPDELPKLLRDADVVVNSTPLTDATRGLFNARMFAAMKPTAYFINVGRGGSVVTDDLIQALNKGVIAGAGLDVTDPEPLPPEHPLWKAKNIIITPHLSARSDITGEASLRVARENLRRYVAGERMFSVVDISRGY